MAVKAGDKLRFPGVPEATVTEVLEDSIFGGVYVKYTFPGSPTTYTTSPEAAEEHVVTKQPEVHPGDQVKVYCDEGPDQIRTVSSVRNNWVNFIGGGGVTCEYAAGNLVHPTVVPGDRVRNALDTGNLVVKSVEGGVVHYEPDNTGFSARSTVAYAVSHLTDHAEVPEEEREPWVTPEEPEPRTPWQHKAYPLSKDDPEHFETGSIVQFKRDRYRVEDWDGEQHKLTNLDGSENLLYPPDMFELVQPPMPQSQSVWEHKDTGKRVLISNSDTETNTVWVTYSDTSNFELSLEFLYEEYIKLL